MGWNYHYTVCISNLDWVLDLEPSPMQVLLIITFPIDCLLAVTRRV